MRMMLHIQTLAASKFLHRPKIDAFHDKPTGELVTQNMRHNVGQFSMHAGSFKGRSETMQVLRP